MDTRKLGKNGPAVSALGLGCMGMTGIYGEPDDPESIATIHRAIDLGINLIVTSDAYGAGANEELVGRAIKGKRNRVLLATKFGNMGLSGFKLPEGLSAGHPRYVPQACDASLKRLGVESIDIYGLHRVDPKVPIEDTVGAMKKLVDQGKVRRRDHPRFNPDNLKRNLALLQPLESIAAAHKVTPAQVALAWMLAQGQDVVPIPGTKRRIYLEQNAAAAGLALSAAEIAQLAKMFPPGVASGTRYPEKQLAGLGI